jgi:protein tyrosine phosphatase (PTP) superfamily phosphohydrolase (DUF442 family)
LHSSLTIVMNSADSVATAFHRSTHLRAAPLKIKRGVYIPAAVAVFVVILLVWRYHDNYHAVIKGELYRSGFLSTVALDRKIHEDKLATVINLCPEVDQTEEKEKCRAENVQYVYLPLDGSAAPSPEETSRLLEALASSPKPILIHCRSGADRVGYAAALYLYKLKGVDKGEASKALSWKYGHLPLLMPWTRVFDDAIAQME